MSAAPSDERLPGAASAGFHVRAMREGDLQAVLDIERRAYGFPWSENIFRECLRASYYCCVLEGHDVIIGYSVMTTGAGEAHVLNLCVAPERRRQGLARALLSHLLEAAHAAGAQLMLLEVRPSNTPAIELYKQFGFSRIGHRKNYYPDRNGREDAVVMSRRI